MTKVINNINLSKLTQSRANTLLNQVSQSTDVADATAMYGDKTFGESYSGSKSFASGMATVAQLISAVLASSYVYFQIALPAIPFAVPYLSEGLAGIFSLLILSMLEYLKREILTSLSVSYFKAKSKKVAFKVWLLPVAILLTMLSVYTSFEGAKLFVSQSDKSNIISDDYGARIAALTKEETDFRKSISWKGKIDTYNKTNAKILAGFEDRKAALHAEKNKAVGTHQTDISSKGTNVAIFSLFMEILAICAFFFIAYVNFYVFVESHTQQISTAESESMPVEKIGFSSVPNSTIAPNNQSSKVGFQFGSSTSLEGISPEGKSLEGSTKIIQLQANERICKHCNKVFTFKHWNATYCSRECKNIAWEQRTGKKLNFKKGGKN
ncbi:MAG: hypothetical protein EAZ08_09085 [Cytophagales bacterium]|nr:MAG: hypothetical protein EAZ08_09085 [Cytophagales bacterium]